MDPAMQPINGISLERYAELGAAISDTNNDTAKERQIIEGEGVRWEDWEAAKTGWTARMQDMSLMGRVATAYMPLYQAALAKQKGGAASISYEDFVAVSAAIKAFGFEPAIQACGISMSDWTEAAGQWNTTMQQDQGRYMGHFNAITAEEQRLRAGGHPPKVQVTRTAGAMPVQAPQPAYTGGDPMQAAMAQAMNTPYMQQQMAANQAIANNPLGFAAGQVGAALTGGIMAGSQVAVTWSDGNKYPGTVMQAAPGQFLVQFQNGSQQWVAEGYVSKA